MNFRTIRTKLKPYSLRSRGTTINHAFASALAPVSKFDEGEISRALESLGLDPLDLKCTYCELPAKTWDHLVSLVKDSELHGYGHQIGNLVPACKDCNSEKGAKDFKAFLEKKIPNARKRQELIEKLEKYLREHAFQLEYKLELMRRRHKNDWDEFQKVKAQILLLMEKGDKIAERLRSTLV